MLTLSFFLLQVFLVFVEHSIATKCSCSQIFSCSLIHSPAAQPSASPRIPQTLQLRGSPAQAIPHLPPSRPSAQLLHPALERAAPHRPPPSAIILQPLARGGRGNGSVIGNAGLDWVPFFAAFFTPWS
jgi:hypothetical protein